MQIYWAPTSTVLASMIKATLAGIGWRWRYASSFGGPQTEEGEFKVLWQQTLSEGLDI